MFRKSILIALCFIISISYAKESNKVSLGTLKNGVTFFFVQGSDGNWGFEISGGNMKQLIQPKPANVEVFESEESIREFATGYKSVHKSGKDIDAIAEISYGEKVLFRINDKWSLKDETVLLKRKVEVSGDAVGGFNSSLVIDIDSSARWSDINFMAPGVIYADPTYNGDRSAGGTINYDAHRFIFREDILPAPLLALSFKNGTSVSIMDPTPNGASTVDETKLLKNSMTDSRIQFGSFGAWQTDKNLIEFGFKFPATTSMLGFGPTASAKPRWIRRFHPITSGFSHSYEVNFRFGVNESFRDLTKNSWRWAWNNLKPAVTRIDVELVRKVLLDHLASQAASIDGRTGIPFAVATYDTNKVQWNWTMSAMGFVSKNIECADQLLREGERDKTERGQKMRTIGLGIISSMINALSDIPLKGTGYDLATGKPWTGDHKEWLAPWLRNATEDMRVLMRAYKRERLLGSQHPEWIGWVKKYVDWLLLQQREDGSFPRRWKEGTNEVAEPTGSTSYCPVPLLVLLSEETGDAKYKAAAIRAAEYVWNSWGVRGVYVGGASDNPNITDKEAGMLSMEAFLSLYESTKDSKWLEYAKSAGDYAESWIWIWNLPMPIDAIDKQLHWKKGVPTIGLQGITARGPGGTDEYLDWAVSSYAKLYEYTKDKHYFDVAMILLHDTKSMVALPGRLYDMKAAGFQQEGFGMGPGRNGRGVGGHRFWLPWISANHLSGITGLEEFDPVLYKKMIQAK